MVVFGAGGCAVCTLGPAVGVLAEGAVVTFGGGLYTLGGGGCAVCTLGPAAGVLVAGTVVTFGGGL